MYALSQWSLSTLSAFMSLEHALPEPLLRHVLLQLARTGEEKALGAVACSCRSLAELAAEDELWLELWQRSWPSGWGMLRRQHVDDLSGAPCRPAPVELAHAMAASSPPQQQEAQVAAAMALLSVCTRASEAAPIRLPATEPPPLSSPRQPSRGTGRQESLVRELYRLRSEAVRRQRASIALPRPLASTMGQGLAVATGNFVLEGHVKDGSDGNVTPARVELALSHGYSGSETPLVAAAGSSPKTVEGSAAGGAATSSAYARAGSLHASVQYGQGTLHNSPSKAVWSGGWCGFHSHGLLLLLA